MSALATAWGRRSPKERSLIAAIAWVAAIVLLATFAWLPLERQRARLAEELPRLRASIAALERDADAVKKLKAIPPRAAVAPVAALASGPAPLAGAQLAAIDERHVRVTATDVGFAALLDWLQAVQASHGLRVETARLEAQPVVGRVRGELVLVRG